jgi:hypothetical protein
MTVELANDKLDQLSSTESKGTTDQRMVLPEPAAQKDVVRWCRAGKGEGRTFTMDPKERLGTYRFPFVIKAPLEEPICSSLVMSITCSGMVGGRIWWREPSM